jgi:hypothetical protein
MSGSRLDASEARDAVATSRAVKTFECLECGKAAISTAVNAEFCSSPCRKAWNNRRLTRGAELYDFMMVLRFDRGRAKALRLWTLMCRLVAIFREEDWNQRAGRRSWSPAEQVVEKKAFLHAIVVLRQRRRAR